MRLKSSVFGCLIVLHAGVFADSASWTNPMDGDWSHSSNWTDSSIPNSPTDTATFPSVLENSSITVTVDASYDVASLNFTDPSESGGYFITATGSGVLHLYDSISVSTGSLWSSRIDSPLVLENTISISTTQDSGLLFTTGGITGTGGITLRPIAQLILVLRLIPIAERQQFLVDCFKLDRVMSSPLIHRLC
ncbi:MAG: hypothetical protein NTX49_08630 [Chlamydiae bacterium]|nr:hypothetical protein [Chlamydiota bacterium]